MRKVLFCARADLLSQPGGDTVQVLKTREALQEAHGLDVVLALEPAVLDSHRDADLAHVFNLQTVETSLAFVQAAEALGLPIALSPIYWNLWSAALVERLRSRWPRAPVRGSRALESLWRRGLHGSRLYGGLLGHDYVARRRSLLERAHLLLPNSPEELAILGQDFRLEPQALQARSRVIPNAVDTRQWPTPAAGAAVRPASVAIVGRIEPTKNQLDTLRALRDCRDVPVRLIGRLSSNPLHRPYCDAVLREVRAHAHFSHADQLPHEAVRQELLKARVHVLASFRESPGLATLEALHAGCRIVTSGARYCPTRYYRFDQLGSQCDPFRIDSIRQAVLRELAADRPPAGAGYFDDFSYGNAARLTLQAYGLALASGTGRRVPPRRGPAQIAP